MNFPVVVIYRIRFKDKDIKDKDILFYKDKLF